MAIVSYYLILLLLFLGFFGNSLFDYGILPGYFAAITEIAIVILFIFSLFWKAITKEKYYVHYFFVGLFLGELVISIVVNNCWSMGVIYSLRNLFRFYILYIALVNLPLNEILIKKVNKFLLIFLALQLPVAAVKFMKYGINEMTMGAYAVHEGSLTTMIPTVAIIYFLAYFHFYNKNKLYLLLIVGFILYAIVGKKRAIIFFIPAAFAFFYYLIYWRNVRHLLPKRLVQLIVASIVALLIIIVTIIINPTLNPEHRIGGRINLDYTLNYVKKYTTGIDAYGDTTGRTSTTLRVLRKLSKRGLCTFLFGFGPGKITSSIFEPKRKIAVSKFLHTKMHIKYGLTPFTSISIEYGMLGGVLYSILLIWFIFLSKKFFKLEKESYWKAFASGTYGFSVFMLVFYFCYHPPALLGDTYPLCYFYIMAVAYWRLKQLI